MGLIGIHVDPDILRIARMRKRMTQQEVADAVGVAKNTISRIEHGERNPSPELLDRLSDVLGHDEVLSSLTEEGSAIYQPHRHLLSNG